MEERYPHSQFAYVSPDLRPLDTIVIQLSETAYTQEASIFRLDDNILSQILVYSLSFS